jgi:hypothetical protein
MCQPPNKVIKITLSCCLLHNKLKNIAIERKIEKELRQAAAVADDDNDDNLVNTDGPDMSVIPNLQPPSKKSGQNDTPEPASSRPKSIYSWSLLPGDTTFATTCGQKVVALSIFLCKLLPAKVVSKVVILKPPYKAKIYNTIKNMIQNAAS